ncbi:MAG: hypothetical protein OEL89_00490 [Candidatus Peregrinibacteria bacterium]|nr:hypothetical protein [Candidatus Peregrinibacteria bacterium]
MKIPEDFDVNIIEIMKDCLEEDFKKDKNVVGASEVPFCIRKTVLRKLHGKDVETTPKMLFGKIFETVLYLPHVLSSLICHVNHQLGLKVKEMEIQSQAKGHFELKPGKYLRMHPDIYTSHYIIEVKTSFTPLKIWSHELIPYHAAQLNTYMGYWNVPFGFILMVNEGIFKAQDKDNNWNTFWKKYCYFVPVTFDLKLYQDTLLRALTVFDCIEQEICEIDCPEFEWECKYCNVLEECGKEVIKCEFRDQFNKKCGKKMYEWRECLTPEFVETPACRNCHENKLKSRKDYEKFKHKKKFPWSVVKK